MRTLMDVRIRLATDEEKLARARANGSKGNILVEGLWKGKFNPIWIPLSSHSTETAAEKAAMKARREIHD